METITTDKSPAEIYDERFVPALFVHWGPVVAAAAHVSQGQHVLDVGCGTGALTLAVAAVVGPEGSVVGLDANPDMLTVARRKRVPVEWMQGHAEALPLPADRFDAVVSQFAFMFFEDKPKALREMLRVLRPGGRLAVAVCDAVDNSPGYREFARLLDRLFGREIGDAFRAPFSLGDPERLHALSREAAIPDARVEHRSAAVRFESIDAMVSTERACIWTLGGLLDERQFRELIRQSRSVMRPFVVEDGTIEFDMPSLILTARKEGG